MKPFPCTSKYPDKIRSRLTSVGVFFTQVARSPNMGCSPELTGLRWIVTQKFTFSGIKRPGREADFYLQSRLRTNGALLPLPLFISVATRLTKHRNNSVLIFVLRMRLRDNFVTSCCYSVYFSRWSAVRNVIAAFTSHTDWQFETSARRLLHTLTGNSKRQHSVYFTRWAAVRNVITAFTSHADRQFWTPARHLLHTLTGSSKLQHGIYFTHWPAIRNVSTAFTSHTDRQFETSSRRLLHMLTGSSKLQHGIYFTHWPAVRNVITAFTSHADRQFQTSARHLLHTLTGSSKRQPTRQIRATESQTQLQMSVEGFRPWDCNLSLPTNTSFSSGQKKLDRPSTDRHLSRLCLDENTRSSCFVCGYNIWTEGVFVIQLSGKAGNLNLTNCAGRDKIALSWAKSLRGLLRLNALTFTKLGTRREEF